MQPYGPQHANPYAGNRMKNALGVWALVLGILTIVFSWVPFLGFGSYVTGVVGVALGIFGIRRVKYGAATNQGVSIAGVTTSGVGLASVVLATVVYSAFMYAASTETAQSAATGEPTNVVATDEATPSSEPTTHYTPTPNPSPDGTFTGTCDYELGSSLGDYALLGEVDVENAGNVGIVVKVKITWPQYGHDPVKETKKVRVGYGQSKTVRFNRDATGTEIDRLQSWQQRHDYEPGCTYKGRMLDTFGQVHS